MKKILNPLLLLLISTLAFAQKGKVTGTVSDDTNGETLISASVVIDESTGTTTDFDGKYELTLDPGNYVLTVSYIGYEPKQVKVKIDAGQTLVRDIPLAMTAKDIGLVTVTGGKYEKKIGEEVVSIEVLRPEFISNSNSTGVDEALDKVPGVNMVGEQINIRGGSGFTGGASNRVLMLMDGLPLLKPDNASIDFASLPLENVEQIEVIKGASSALYGSSALNGIINLITANPKNERYTKVTTFVGVYENPFKGKKKNLMWWNRNKMFWGANVGYRQKFGQLDVVVGANYFEDESYLYNNQTRRFNTNVKLRYRPKKNPALTIGLNTNFSFQEGGFFFIWRRWGETKESELTDEGIALYNEFLRRLENNEQITGTFLDSVPKEGMAYLPTEITTFRSVPVSFDPFITYFDKKDNMHSFKGRVYLTYYRNSAGEVSNANLAYGEYTFTSQLKKLGLNFVTGVSSNYTFINSENIDSKKTSTNAAAFLQLDKKFFKRLTLSFGVRGEYNKIDVLEAQIKPLLRGGFNLQVAEATFFRGSFGQGLRFPSVTEKFVSTRRSGILVVPNADVNYERGWSAELGIKQGIKVTKDWMGYFDVAGFVLQYDDMLEYVQRIYTDRDSFYVDGAIYRGLAYQSVNLTDARISGFEVSLLGQGKLFGVVGTNILVGYTYLRPLDLNAPDSLDFKDKMLTFRFQHSAKADVEATYKKVTLGFTGRYVSFMENIGDELQVKGNIAGYREKNDKGEFILDARIAYNFSDEAKVSFIAKNLANNQYTLRPGYFEAPRNYTLQVAYQF